MEFSLTKLDVARRQLITAIQLFFDQADAVSIFSLAANAWEVVDALCLEKGVNSLSSQSRENIPSEKDLKRDYINQPFRNFFKHADKDPYATVDGFDATKCDAVIFLGIEDYIRLTSKSPVEFQVFQLWFLAIKPTKLADDSILEHLEVAFPNIRNLSRNEQVQMGKYVLEKAREERTVIESPHTEPSTFS